MSRRIALVEPSIGDLVVRFAVVMIVNGQAVMVVGVIVVGIGVHVQAGSRSRESDGQPEHNRREPLHDMSL